MCAIEHQLKGYKETLHSSQHLHPLRPSLANFRAAVHAQMLAW